jgi:uncharacterized membrane protein YgcG
MRAMHFLKRPGREFLRNMIWILVAYAVIAAILTLGARFPLLWGLLVGGGLLAFVWVLNWNGRPHDRGSYPADSYSGGVGGGGDFGGGCGGGDGGGGGC